MSTKITREIIEQLFDRTHYKANNLDFDIIFTKGYHAGTNTSGDRFSLVYYLLQLMSPELGFSAILIHADGGVLEYLITYQWRGYTIIICRQNWLGGGHRVFESVDDLCQWLNGHADRINQKIDP